MLNKRAVPILFSSRVSKIHYCATGPRLIVPIFNCFQQGGNPGAGIR
jgi:hypothetical protein